MHSIPPHMHYRCLVCNKKITLDSKSPSFSTPPLNGVSFSTTGNWGSSVYDLQQHTETVICDDCFVKRADRMMTYHPEDAWLPVEERRFIYVSEIVRQRTWKEWFQKLFLKITKAKLLS